MENLVIIVSRPDNLPILALFIAVPLVMWIAFRRGRATDRAIASGRTPLEAMLGPEAELPARVPVWPYLLRIELLAAMIVVIGLLAWSIGLDAPLEDPASPNVTPNPSKAPWYFLGLQELLTHFDPWIAGVTIPVVIILGLAAIPYIDPNPKGNGYYTLRERPFAVSVFCTGFLLWVMLIVIGTFIRGPGWIWFWPWERWDHTRAVAEASVDWCELLSGGRITAGSRAGQAIGWATIVMWFWGWVAVPRAVLRARGSPVLERMGRARYVIAALLFAAMTFVMAKIGLKLAFSVKYILVTPFFSV